ncbi:MAG: type II toxin-antitoxin system prevent-host-death family antitoxin [Gammaproteobacteria bacterium]|nr:type II toxin-antitoxin system prevent-host-death family antitoxin [Gammaproteobacteria bacterium]MBV8306397.1 type II toxin-antitoxin system prevent-host-death family antitoxin [Gammaproteobacteria bacterium]MBV8404618.1 type II toxin-antitoxin system prevent-host-death family antitoxin [Gammaproteobacteria bacterium]
MKTEIGAYEAKTKLPELLREVQAGKRFVITNRGKPVAELGPPINRARPDAKAAIEAFQAFRKAHPVGKKIDIRALLEEGRE